MLFSWVLFRADSLGAAGQYFAAMFGLNGTTLADALLGAEIYQPLPLVAMLAAAFLVIQPRQAHEWSQSPQTWARTAYLLPLFAVSLLLMFSQAFNPFLYFQF
jgi:hypothetical protein